MPAVHEGDVEPLEAGIACAEVELVFVDLQFQFALRGGAE
jgi:hypothetical protein